MVQGLALYAPKAGNLSSLLVRELELKLELDTETESSHATMEDPTHHKKEKKSLYSKPAFALLRTEFCTLTLTY